MPDTEIEATGKEILSCSRDGRNILVEIRSGESSLTLKKVICLNSAQDDIGIINAADEAGAWKLNGESVVSRTTRDFQLLQARPNVVHQSTRDFLTIDGVRFRDSDGNPVVPGQTLMTWYPPPPSADPDAYSGSLGATGLFAIFGETVIEITSPDFPIVRRFAYDSAQRRILTEGGLLFDLNSLHREVLGWRVGGVYREQIFFLVPGQDLVLVQENTLTFSGHDIAKIELHIRDRAGTKYDELSLEIPGAEGNGYPVNIISSAQLIGYILGNHVRMYAILEEQGE